ncbi:MAG: hypothetical protein V3V09_01510, partial [Arenicellales bacterium]
DALPDEHEGKQNSLNFDALPSVEGIMQKLGLDLDSLQFVLAEGGYIEIEQWAEPITADNIQLWPRMSGG